VAIRKCHPCQDQPYLSHKFVLQNNDLECVSRYKYLGIWFNNSGSFNFAQNELYRKALKALFKLKSDFLVHNPEVKTSIHVFDHTIKPILLNGCEIWGYFVLTVLQDWCFFYALPKEIYRTSSVTFYNVV
jgi:hypothetical protein